MKAILQYARQERAGFPLFPRLGKNVDKREHRLCLIEDRTFQSCQCIRHTRTQTHVHTVGAICIIHRTETVKEG